MLNTKDAAKRTGLSEVTLRIYEKDGRFPPASRDSYGHLQWTEQEVGQWIANRAKKTAST